MVVNIGAVRLSTTVAYYTTCSGIKGFKVQQKSHIFTYNQLKVQIKQLADGTKYTLLYATRVHVYLRLWPPL